VVPFQTSFNSMNTESHILFKRGTLREALENTTEHALSIGALTPIPTEYDFIEDGGVKFFVRVLTSLALKDEERKKRGEAAETGHKVNPFLPYEKELFVDDVSRTHVALLNKFNVVEHHLLIVTREFEDQETLLTPADFEALWACLSEYESLGFYNGGEAAGASQSHKHLQVVPLPLAPEGQQIPIEPLFAAAVFDGELGRIPGLPFLHVVVRLDPHIMKSPLHAAEKTYRLYGDMLRHVKMKAPVSGRKERQSAPYCLLVAREWMLLVPRSQEFFEGISINSLGYAGALLVRNEEQMAILKKCGPIAALKNAALPSEEAAKK
jgi:ATP adenylyltransferase